MKKSKFIVSFIIVILSAAAFSIALAACSNPSGEEGKAVFTINLDGSGRMAYGPGNTEGAFPTYNDLKYELTFSTANGKSKQTFTGDLSSGAIHGEIEAGEYSVGLKIRLKADSSVYANDDDAHNPVTINPIPNNAISVQMVKDPNVVEVEDGSSGKPFLVYDVATLQKVGSGTGGWGLDKHYRQMRDINLTSVSNWTPIGDGNNPFAGNYEGNGKTISNLKLGLFGCISGSGAIIKNVRLDCDIAGGDWVGGVAGINEGMVQDCYIMGKVSGTQNVGGVVGYNKGTVKNCRVMGEVSGWSEVGGIVGKNDGGTVQNCYATGKVEGNNYYVGGVVGDNSGTVESCYATGKVSGSGSVGGVVGTTYGGIVQYCYATGAVEGGSRVGGVVGVNGSIVQYCYATGNVLGTDEVGGVAGYHGMAGRVDNCYATGKVEGTGHGIGGVAGSSAEGAVHNCYATGDVSGDEYVGGVLGDNGMAWPTNCVALNQNISGTDNVGRVIGNSTGSSNYGRKDMMGGNKSSNENSSDGADITVAQWGVKSWWTTTSNWNTGSGNAWDFDEVWEWGGSLPILKNMPGRTQDPSVKNN